MLVQAGELNLFWLIKKLNLQIIYLKMAKWHCFEERVNFRSVIFVIS